MATIGLTLKPFTTPNYVQAELPPSPRESGVKELPSFPLKELSQDALDELVADFISDVYNKASKPSPWSLSPQVLSE